MRILHTIYDHPLNPWLGGGGAFRTFEICKRLAKRHDITVVCGSYPGCTDGDEDGFQVIHIGASTSYTVSRLSYMLRGGRHVANVDPDLWVYSFSAFAPLKADRRSKSRSILECFHLMGDHASRKRGLIGHVASAAEKKTVRAYDEIISISPSVMETIATLRGTDEGLRLVYTGCDASCFIDDSVEEDFLLYFGRLDPYTKGLDLLFAAFARAAPATTKLRLVIAGRGTPGRVAELENLAREQGILERVTFTGPVDLATKTDLFRRSLFNVLPSRYEGWCMVAIESAAAGKAVVGTRIPGLQDAVRHEETGLLASPENIEEIAAAIARLIEDADLRRKLGSQGRTWAEQFTWDNISAAQEQVYMDVSEKRREAHQQS